ncbi:MAG: DUF924 domain-containing protein [Rhizobiaceae bacterium]|jgi:uncharacterized protein (DUF924 family)|nr:DUF924 domain-containing protein [Rhizobiaceae bacterium]
MKTDKIDDVLDFWFEQTSAEQRFTKDLAFDETIRSRFGDLIEDALDGKLASWSASKNGLMALVIIFDQFTRNIYRDTAKAFAGDVKALALSLEGQERGYLESFDEYWRIFLLMPMMHSEDLAVQELSLPLFEKYTDAETHDYAVRHRDIIKRFGRFPHRNEALGRETTEEEFRFLQQPGSSF